MDVCVIAQNYKCEVCQDRHLWRQTEHLWYHWQLRTSDYIKATQKVIYP